MSVKQKTSVLAMLSFAVLSITVLFTVATMIYLLSQGGAQAETNYSVDATTTQSQIPMLTAKENLSNAPEVVASKAKENSCDLHANNVDCNEQHALTTAMDDQNVVAEKNPAWKVGGIESPSIPLNEKIVDYEVVEIDQHPERFPQVGEQVTLPMLNGQEVVIDVQSISTSANGDQTWSGHLQGQGTDYPVIMTYGESSVFAMITTPEGSYSMQSVNGVGWLYKNPSELELSTTGTHDYLEVTEIM